MFINDNIFGIFEISGVIENIVLSDGFQRLQNIAQLGSYSLLDKDCCHSRYEHSLGCYYLTNKLIRLLQIVHPEQNITDREVLLVGISALLHDVSHSAFSHTFDHWLENQEGLVDKNKAHHEYRSKYVLNDLLKEHLSELEINQVYNMIEPTDSIYINSSRAFLYSLVNNKKTFLDTDKMHYLLLDSYYFKKSTKEIIKINELITSMRIINNELCIDEKHYIDVVNIFTLRYSFHREFYSNARTLSVDLLLNQILDIINKDGLIVNIVNNMDFNIRDYYSITDKFIFGLAKENSESDIILNKVLNNKLPKIVFSQTVPKDVIIDVKRIEQKYPQLKVKAVTIGLVSGNNPNPLKCVKFYSSVDRSFTKDNFAMFQEVYQEKNYHIFNMLDNKLNDRAIINIYKVFNYKKA